VEDAGRSPSARGGREGVIGREDGEKRE